MPVPALSICILAASQPATSIPPALDRVEEVFDQDVASKPAGSVEVGVVSRGQLIWSHGFGEVKAGSHRQPDTRTVYRIGSITKQFTAILLLQAAERGELKLNDPVSLYVPEIARVQGMAPIMNDVTLLSLATHRAGLSREPVGDQLFEGPMSLWQSKVLEALPTTKVEFAVNGEAHYSNIGYAILGLALERALHRPYVDLVTQRVIQPLGLTDTTFSPSPRLLSRLATGYTVDHGQVSDGQSTDALRLGRGYKIPNGGLFTTLDDMAKFLAFEEGFAGDSVLPRSVWIANTTRSYPMETVRYGIGFIDQSRGSVRTIGHGGEVGGYTSYSAYDPVRNVGIVCLGSATYQCSGTAPKAFAILSEQADKEY